VAFVGGINISSVYSSGSFGRSKPTKGKQVWRDTHLRMSGPVVSEFQKLFIATWSEQKGEPLASRNYFPAPSSKGDEVVRAIGSSPEEPYNQMYVTLLSAINSAESKIYLTNAYFVPDPQLLAALKEAVQRGVEVKLLLPDKTDSNLVFYASRSFYDELLSAGVQIFERQEALLHAKTGVIDGVWSTIGSTNLDWRSFTNNQEINAVLLGQGFGAQMEALFEKDLTISNPITLEAWRSRSLFLRVKERAARLWARML
jgi:cardiolipin synthase